MKKVLTLVFLLISGYLQSQGTFNDNDLDAIVKGERDAHAGKLSGRAHETAANFDVKWYRCYWNIDPAIREISGNVTTLFVPGAQGLDSLVLDLNQALTIDSVVYHGTVASSVHTGDLLVIRFPNLVPPDNADSVTVFYHGVPPENGFGSFSQGTHSGTPVIWTLSEPYGSSDWWPCKNGLTDKADSIDVFIRTPAAYKAVSNGVLNAVTPAGPDMLYHWKHRYPIAAYLVCLAVTNYATYSHQVFFGGETLNVVNYIYPEDSASVATQTGVIVPMIKLFDSLFEIYPFQNEQYGHAQFGWGGGMEHQTMTFVSSFGFELLAHELAHQWFGDKVTCGTWTEIWLNEGFATYLSGLCYEHLAPAWWNRFREVRVKSIVSQPGGSVYCPDTTSVERIFDGRLSYAKGGMILHQLRWILGDQDFFNAMNHYISDANLAYGFVRTDDFKTHLESESGQDLTWYFNDWYTGEGFPSYHLNWNQSGDSVSFAVSQTQSHPSVPFFEMPVPVQFKNATRDTILRFLNTFQGQEFTAMIPFKVDSVIVDPEYQLITGSNTVNAVTEFSGGGGLQVFPNPASGQVTFRMGQSRPADDRRIYIYDYSGCIKYEQVFKHDESEWILQTGNFPPGLYFYDFTQSGSRITGKFVVLH
jgi:aminopeptidase N